MENLLRDITFSRFGYAPEEGELALKVASELRSQYGRADIQRAAGLVKKAFETVGRTDCTSYHVFRGLHLNPEVDEQSVKLASLAYMCLGRVTQHHEKAANSGLLKRVAAGIPAILGGGIKTIGTVGAVAGVPIGGAAWLMHRGLTGQSKELRELEIQRDTYGRLAAEVEQEMKRRNLEKTPENIAATVDYLT